MFVRPGIVNAISPNESGLSWIRSLSKAASSSWSHFLFFFTLGSAHFLQCWEHCVEVRPGKCCATRFQFLKLLCFANFPKSLSSSAVHVVDGAALQNADCFEEPGSPPARFLGGLPLRGLAGLTFRFFVPLVRGAATVVCRSPAGPSLVLRLPSFANVGSCPTASANVKRPSLDEEAPPPRLFRLLSLSSHLARHVHYAPTRVTSGRFRSTAFSWLAD